MLSQNDLSTLYQIISDESKTFEYIANTFQKSFSKIEQFKVGLSLWIIIKENLLNITQRLSSFYILYDMYRQEEVQTTPFIPLLLECLENSSVNIEKKMLIGLIEFTFSSSKLTVREYIDSGKTLEDIIIPDMEQYWRMHDTTKEKCNQEINDWISPVIYDSNENNFNHTDISKSEKSPENLPLFDLTKMSPEEISFDCFEPNFLTYYPNSNYQFYNEEPMWILPTLKYDFIWDFTMAPIQETLSNLLNKPLKNKALTEEQNNFIIECIDENPNILNEIGFKPDNFFELIEKNEILATEILYKISGHHGFENYLTLFLEKNWSVNSLKVANKIIQKVELPPLFITKYIKHIIQNYVSEKKDSKIRLAKLITIFINNLLDHEHINVKMIPSEIKEIFDGGIQDDDIRKLQEKINQIQKGKEDEIINN